MPGDSSGSVVHGGQVFSLARQFACRPEEILDFSASINPLGLPASVRLAIEQSLDLVVHYPEQQAAGLVAALARKHDVEPCFLLAGAGATEFIYQIPRAFNVRHALIVAPAFGEYAAALSNAGISIAYHQLGEDDDFALNADRLIADLTPETDLLVMANPANPTGMGYPRVEMLALLEMLPASVTLLLDEAFVDFCPEFSILDQVPRYANLLVMRSLTKFYAIPGLRVGFLAGSAESVARLRDLQEPWRLSVPGVAAALACLEDEDYRQQTQTFIPRWRAGFAAELASLGCRVSPAAANYLLCSLPESLPVAREIATRLLPHKVLVRACDDFVGLGDRALRLAVRRPEENRRLLDLLTE